MTLHSNGSGGMELHYRRTGRGAPLILIHGVGHRHQMWDPVIDKFDGDFDAVAVDLPGFGLTARMPVGDVPTPERLADCVEATMNQLGWPAAHFVGNSLGAWISLELASRGRALSVCAFMPAGLWRSTTGLLRLRGRTLFALWTNGARIPFAGAAARSSAVRAFALSGLFGRPWRIPADVAVGDVQNLKTCDFIRTFEALDGSRFEHGGQVKVPVTIVFGGRDPLIRAGETDTSGLPDDTEIIRIPHFGHVPTWDDPELVASIIKRAQR